MGFIIFNVRYAKKNGICYFIFIYNKAVNTDVLVYLFYSLSAKFRELSHRSNSCKLRLEQWFSNLNRFQNYQTLLKTHIA